jgi:hypothetical protein
LKKAGLEGDMDVLRARAYLDLLLGKDSRPATPPAPPATGQDNTNGEPGSENREPSSGGEPGGGGKDSEPGSGGENGEPGSGGENGENCSGGENGENGGPDGPCGDGPDGPGDGGSPAPDTDEPGIPPTTSVLPAGFAGRINLTVPLATLLDLAERPGEISGLGPIDPALARDLARAAAANLKTTWCLTVTDEHGHAIGHGCARPEPRDHAPTGHDPPGRPGTGPLPGFTFTATGDHGPPGGYGSWRLSTGLAGQQALLLALDPIALQECDHRFEARGHDPGVKLRHLTQIRHATCTGPTCRRPSTQADFEHNIPYEAGGRTCMCNGGPTCRHEHRLKQHPAWKVEQITPGTFRRTAPSGRQYITEPTRYPILWDRPPVTSPWPGSRTPKPVAASFSSTWPGACRVATLAALSSSSSARSPV